MSPVISIIFTLLLVVNKVESASEITGFSLGTGTLPDGWDYHRGFYSAADEKIYFIGQSRNGGRPWVFDLATQTAQEYIEPGVSENLIATVWIQYGAAINNVYYFTDQDTRRDIIQKFDPINKIYDPTFITAEDGLLNIEGPCLTSDNDKTLYIIRDTLKKVDVTQSIRTAVDLAPPPESSYNGACAYYNGYIYAFAGRLSTAVQKYNVAQDSWENINGISLSFDGGEAAIAENGKIYVGGAREKVMYEFDPVTETLIRTPDLTEARSNGAVIYSKYDHKLYVFGGQQERKSYDVSNALDPCAGVICTAPDVCSVSTCVDGSCEAPSAKCPANLVCDIASGECKRDCNAFQIDDFLRDCSAEFTENVDDITDITTRITDVENDLKEGGDTEGRLDIIEADIDDNDNDITTIQGRLDQLDTETWITSDPTRIGQAETDIDSVQIDVAALKTETGINNGVSRLDALETETGININNNPTRLDQLETETRISSNPTRFVQVEDNIVALQNEVAVDGPIKTRLDTLETKTGSGGTIDIRLNDIQTELDKYHAAYSPGGQVINDDVMKDATSFLSNESKDMLVIFLLILNSLLIVSSVIACVLWNKSRGKYHQYNNTKVYSSDDENQQLRR